MTPTLSSVWLRIKGLRIFYFLSLAVFIALISLDLFIVIFYISSAVLGFILLFHKPYRKILKASSLLLAACVCMAFYSLSKLAQIYFESFFKNQGDFRTHSYTMLFINIDVFVFFLCSLTLFLFGLVFILKPKVVGKIIPQKIGKKGKKGLFVQLKWLAVLFFILSMIGLMFNIYFYVSNRNLILY